MSKKKKKSLHELSLEDLEKKKKTYQTLIYILIGLAISFAVILILEVSSGDWSSDNNTMIIMLICLLGVLPSTFKEQKEVVKELESRNLL